MHKLIFMHEERGRTFKSIAGITFQRQCFNELQGFKRSWHQNQKQGGCRHVLLLDLTNTSSLPKAVDRPFPSTIKHSPVAFTVCLQHK